MDCQMRMRGSSSLMIVVIGKTSIDTPAQSLPYVEQQTDVGRSTCIATFLYDPRNLINNPIVGAMMIVDHLHGTSFLTCKID